MCNDYGNRIPYSAYLEAFSQLRIPVRFHEAAPNLEPRDDIWPTDTASVIRDKLNLPIDTPRRIEAGTMQKFWNWTANPVTREPSTARVEKLLARFEQSRIARQTEENA